MLFLLLFLFQFALEFLVISLFLLHLAQKLIMFLILLLLLLPEFHNLLLVLLLRKYVPILLKKELLLGITDDAGLQFEIFKLFFNILFLGLQFDCFLLLLVDFILVHQLLHFLLLLADLKHALVEEDFEVGEYLFGVVFGDHLMGLVGAAHLLEVPLDVRFLEHVLQIPQFLGTQLVLDCGSWLFFSHSE